MLTETGNVSCTLLALGYGKSSSPPPPPLLTRYVDTGARIQMGPSHITIQRDGAVTFTALPDFLRVCEIFHAVCHYIGGGHFASPEGGIS